MLPTTQIARPTTVAARPDLTTGIAPLNRSINADLVQQTLAAKAVQRPLVPAATPRRAMIAFPDGTLLPREEYMAAERDNYQTF